MHSPDLIEPGDHIGGFKVERTEQAPSGGTRLHLEGGGRILLGPHDHGHMGQGHTVHRLREGEALFRRLKSENPNLTVKDSHAVRWRACLPGGGVAAVLAFGVGQVKLYQVKTCRARERVTVRPGQPPAG